MMGYTVYWTIKKQPTPAQRSAIVNYIRSLLKKYKDVIRVEFPSGNNNQEINFNGIGELSHETFTFYKEKDEKFNFCKTAEKPYDRQVKLALIYMKKVLGDSIEISCDGDAETDPPGWKEVLKG